MPGLIEMPPMAPTPPPPPWAGGAAADFPGRTDLLFGPDRVETAAGAAARLEMGPKGFYGLSHCQDGRTVRLASAVDPAAEDRALVERFDLKPGRGVLCLGLGLGYHLEELAGRLAPEEPLWVLESRPELAACALRHRDLSALFQRPGFRLFVGPFTDRPWGEGETPPDQALWRPATLRHFVDEYPMAGRRPAARPRPALRRLLLVQSGYFLDRELQNAAGDLGLTTASWHFQRGLTASGDNFQELLDLLKKFRPELVLTVNHLGFDREGRLDDLFARLSLPAASWFVDSPAFILGDHRPGPAVAAFAWDRDYLPGLRERGFRRVHYLPLATDERFFHPAARPAAPTRAVTFVGDSLTAATVKYLAKLGLGAEHPRLSDFVDAADRLATDFLARPDLRPAPGPLERLAIDFDLAPGPERMDDLAALVTWRASRHWRQAVLSAVAPGDLTVAGDRHWGPLLNLPPERLSPPLEYYTGLAPFYQSGQVNLNITSAQMKTGLNQRIFDVPAAGGFLLTDHREQLFEHFEPGREAVTYRDPAEARDLAAWHLRHPAIREAVTRAARRRIQDQHLYRHRLAEILNVMGR